MANLLFVDDEQFIIMGMKRLFKALASELEIDYATSGKEALSKIQSKNFDVIITDLFMPEIDGIELLEKVKETQPNTVRIIMTGHIDASFEKMKNDLAHIILSKPIRNEALIDTIRNCIYNKEKFKQQ